MMAKSDAFDLIEGLAMSREWSPQITEFLDDILSVAEESVIVADNSGL